MATDAIDGVHSADSPSGETWAPIQSRELLVALVWTVLADLLIFRTHGFTGPALFLVGVPLCFCLASPHAMKRVAMGIVTTAILAVAFRLVWQGSALAIVSGIMLVIAVSMAAAGVMPLVLEGMALACSAVFSGAARLTRFRVPVGVQRSAKSQSGTLLDSGILAWLIPMAAAVVFGSIFIFANPDLLTWVSNECSRVATVMLDWVTGISIWEAPFCIAALLLGVGLLRPALPLRTVGAASNFAELAPGQAASPWYAVFRNTLVTLIALFAAYLTFEFTTLFRREFPDGFYYAGYAHQGAAWLTFALALATGLLSLVFRPSMLRDPRVDWVRQLAWGWSGLNLLLAIAVYNRLMIYIGFNGMTRMRMIGFFGITVVVIGFALVVYKIAQQRSFWWLIRAQLIALALTIMAYSVFPVDYVSHRYNASQVASGYLHPSVMIAVKPISDEGVFPLLDLAEAQDPIIREGVLAMLAERQNAMKQLPEDHWTAFQWSRSSLARRLAAEQSKWAKYQDADARRSAIAAFKSYAMQWY